MRTNFLPPIDRRYWVALFVASICGTNLGDLASQSFGLGFLGGLAPYAAVFALCLAAPGLGFVRSELFYWGAIVAGRAAATNLADFATHACHLPYPAVLASLALLLVCVLWIGAARGQSTIARIRRGEAWVVLPTGNTTYWVAMLTASVLGTASGDFLADRLGLGVGPGALLLTALTVVLALSQRRAMVVLKPWYWVTILVARTAATNAGDFFAGADGLNLGLPFASVAGLVVLTGLVLAWAPQPLASPRAA
jgi:uncharacterized membrane-anchored protein